MSDGTCFDDSYSRGQMTYFILGSEQVIPAIEMVVPILSRGEKARMIIQPEVDILLNLACESNRNSYLDRYLPKRSFFLHIAIYSLLSLLI